MGLDRLAVSLHTMDAEQYRTLYGLGSLDLLKRKIDDFLEMKAALGVQKPRLDFCFVAMNENVHELTRVVEYAKRVGVAEISVHPIIGRHLVAHDFSRELQGNKLRDGFKETLRKTVAQVKAAHPDFAVNVLNADLDRHPRLTHRPAYFAPSLPAKGKIFGCDQSPFESAHILATGKVVVCEVLDEVPLGDLHQQSLSDIWQREAYQRFRRDYLSNASPECRSCVWKIAYIPDRWASLIDLRDGMNAQLLRGWHTYEESGIIWSRKSSLLALHNPKSHKRIGITGILPHAVAGPNTLSITCNGTAAGEVQNRSCEFLSFEKTISVPSSSPVFHIGFLTERVFRPSLHGAGVDSRDLGFALQRIEVC